MLIQLYKKATTGKIQQWSVFSEGNTYWTESGQVGGKIKKSTPTECEGKNPGKKNETTPAEQAFKEADSKWKSKKKKGYVDTITQAESGEVDSEFVDGGYLPMLAEKIQEFGHKIVYPCIGQPKLEGHRGVCESARLFSKTRKSIFSCPHIEKAVDDAKLNQYPLDGEIYNHAYKDEFEKLSSFIRKSTPQPECLVLQYHLYDIAITGLMMWERVNLLARIEKQIAGTPAADVLKFVPAEVITSAEHAEERRKYWVGLGYEGLIIRNRNAFYQHTRTPDLQKVKKRQDAEFKVLEILDGRGKFKGMAATFICEIDDKDGKRTFRCSANGTHEKLKEYFDNQDKYLGKMLTIEFFTYTIKNNVPRHGRGLRFRDPNF